MAQAALRLDKRFADVKFLKENLWGDILRCAAMRLRLVADIQKLLEHPALLSSVSKAVAVNDISSYFPQATAKIDVLRT